jgi:hypothetical protein
MRIDSNGNVGIGTTSPKNKLDVEGGAVVGATYSGTNTAPSNGLLVEGNVGIGTPAPETALEIKYATPSPTASTITSAQLRDIGLYIRDSSLDNVAGEITSGIAFGYETESNTGIFGVEEGGSGSAGLGFVTGDNTAIAERMRIDNGGNVGIGTTAPTGGKLNVVGDANITGLLRFGSLSANSLNNTYFASNSVNSRVIAASSINTTHIIDGTIGAIDISPNAINSTHIATGAIINADIAANAINTTQIIDGTILPTDLNVAVNTSYDTRYLKKTGDTATGNYTFDTNTLFIDSTNHRIGIGTTTPGAKLDVRGAIYAVDPTNNLNILSISHNGTVSKIYATAYTGGSIYSIYFRAGSNRVC